MTAGLTFPLLVSTGPAQAESGTTAPAAAAPSEAVLSCAIRTAPKYPITFTPPLRDAAARHTEGKGVVLLERCSSPNGNLADIASGRMDVSITATASCRSVADLRATGTVTWRDANGRVAGTSKLTAPRQGGAAPGDSLLEGDVVSGRLTGRHFSGSATMTSDLRDCTVPSGLTELTGSGRLSFA
ncbi:hypothetical protein [Nonomuraea diastatica]|uniref:Uncharacterized protein n=1 Tax=Nonomuraea diastatica TaxID=1848329 RepID=A0A4R4W659_9ACTN|nr:hypothetical protein [Nonomuraea diastatica]TDD11154.1 hypothetical protein E1294_45425 [Nonomuraea diastatica]